MLNSPSWQQWYGANRSRARNCLSRQPNVRISRRLRRAAQVKREKAPILHAGDGRATCAGRWFVLQTTSAGGRGRVSPHSQSNAQSTFSSENQEKALQSLATVLRYLTVTAERVSPEQMRQALEPVLRYEGDKLMSTLAQQWLEQGRQEGLQQGMQQGLWAMRQNIIELLADRWQIPAQRFQDRLKVIEDMETLRLLVRRVATVDDVAEFEQALNTLTKGE